jgi:hypothetical protein
MPGDKVYVRTLDETPGAAGRWNGALLLRYHKARNAAGEQLLKVQYRDGTVEEYVDLADVAKRRPQPSGTTHTFTHPPHTYI